MARVRMVTRTVQELKVEVMVVDTTIAEVDSLTFTLSGDMSDEEAFKLVKKQHETDTLKIVTLQHITRTEEMYGMLETDFIKLAHKLDENRKIVE